MTTIFTNTTKNLTSSKVKSSYTTVARGMTLEVQEETTSTLHNDGRMYDHSEYTIRPSKREGTWNKVYITYNSSKEVNVSYWVEGKRLTPMLLGSKCFTDKSPDELWDNILTYLSRPVIP